MSHSLAIFHSVSYLVMNNILFVQNFQCIFSILIMFLIHFFFSFFSFQFLFYFKWKTKLNKFIFAYCKIDLYWLHVTAPSLRSFRNKMTVQITTIFFTDNCHGYCQIFSYLFKAHNVYVKLLTHLPIQTLLHAFLCVIMSNVF